MYTEHFIKRVLDAYPDNPSLEDALKAGTYGAVAEALRIGSNEALDPMWVLEARTLGQVQQKAAQIVMRNKVYEDFLSEGNVRGASIPGKEQVHAELWNKPKKAVSDEIAPAWEPVVNDFLGYGES